MAIFNDCCILLCCPILIVFNYLSEFSPQRIIFSWLFVGIILFTVIINIGQATFNSWKPLLKLCKRKIIKEAKVEHKEVDRSDCQESEKEEDLKDLESVNFDSCWNEP